MPYELPNYLKVLLFAVTWHTVSARVLKAKKSTLKKSSLYIRKWNLFFLIFKNNSYILSKESFPYISRNGTLHFLSPSPKSKKNKNKRNAPEKKFLIFQEMGLSSSNIKNILIFPEIKPCTFWPQHSKIVHFSLKNLLRKIFLYFLKKAPNVQEAVILKKNSLHLRKQEH